MSTNKVIIRWTIGTVSRQGAKCLKHSVKSFVDCYGQNFDFYICYNSIEKPVLNLGIDLKYIYQEKPILQGSGSIWKYSPARININKNELFIDNDIVFIKKNIHIYNFFTSNKFLICKDNIKYYGKYDMLFNNDEKFNAGIIGVPSGFDLEKNIIKFWNDNGAFANITSADEQGLIASIIKKKTNLIVLSDKDYIILNGYGDSSNTIENLWLAHDTYHFVELNRKYHNYYQKRLIKLL